MIHIERIRMRLPAGFEHRATTITSMVGDILAQQSLTQEVSLEAIALGPQRINTNTSDVEIAQLIATQIISDVTGGRQS